MESLFLVRFQAGFLANKPLACAYDKWSSDFVWIPFINTELLTLKLAIQTVAKWGCGYVFGIGIINSNHGHPKEVCQNSSVKFY